MKNNTYYGDYLALPTILNSQNRKSSAHDEMLFIIIHQTYELWFKQILFELDSITNIFKKKIIPESDMGTVLSRLSRITEIQRILNDQLKIIETMTPLDFMDFRDHLNPASGFQSVQFRLVEMKLGLKLKDRMNFAKSMFMIRLSKEDQKILNAEENKLSLTDYINSWLERLPLSNDKNFSFWSDFEVIVKNMLDKDEKNILANKFFNEDEREIQLQILKSTKLTFNSLFKKSVHDELIKKGERKLSHEAFKSAVFISLYRDEPLLTIPYQIISYLIDIDENFTTWRYRHSMMAHRLLGTKIGTGGSSGHDYLKKSAEHNRAFLDLFNLATFIIPRSKLPKLSKSVLNKLQFRI